MELPHLTLALRRLYRGPAGRPWHRRLWAGRSLLVWQAVAWGTVTLGCWFGLGHLGLRIYLVGRPLFYLAIAASVYWPYLAAAGAMGELAQLPSADNRTSALGPPEWYVSPLSSAAALAGCLVTALLVALPGLLGSSLLVLFLAEQTRATFSLETRLAVGPLLLAQLSMLPTYLLVASCLALALRNTIARGIWPWILAGTAALHAPAALNIALQGNRHMSSWYMYPFTAGQWTLSVGAVPCALGLLVLAAWLLLTAARDGPRQPNGLYILLLMALLFLPAYQYEILAFDSGGLPMIQLFDLYSPQTRYLELLARALYPSAPGTYLEPALRQLGFGRLAWLVPAGVDFYFWWSLAALALWWMAALLCLNAARCAGLPWLVAARHRRARRIYRLKQAAQARAPLH